MQNALFAPHRWSQDPETENDEWVWLATEDYGRTASLISPLRDFIRANACGRSASRISSVTKSRAEISPRLIAILRSEEHTSELQSRLHLVCRLLLEKKKKKEPA